MEDNIELRSKNVQNIIGQIPPRIIRIGISVIFLIILGLLIGSYFFKYGSNIETTAIVQQHNDSTFIKLKIPCDQRDKVKKGNRVLLNLSSIQNISNESVEANIESIETVIEVNNAKGYFIANIYIPKNLQTINNTNIKILSTTEVKAEIITDKISFLERIIAPIKQIQKNLTD